MVRRRRPPLSSALPSGGGDLGREVGAAALLDALAECVAHEACDLDRIPDRGLCLLEGLRDALARIVDVGLIEQADLLVEGLQRSEERRVGKECRSRW